MDEKHVSMKDVARLAGVHQTTVSLVLRNSARIAPATKERVLRVAKELGYRRNPLLTALMANRIQGNRTQQGLKLAYTTSIPWQGEWVRYDPLLPDFFESANARLRELGFSLERCDFSGVRMTPQRFFDILYSRGIHGLMIAPLPESIHLREVALPDLSVISLGRRSVIDGIHKASSNQGYNMRCVLEKCIDGGFVRVGLCLLTARQWEGAWDSLLGSYLAQSYRVGERQLETIAPLLDRDLRQDRFEAWFQSGAPEVVITNKPELVRDAIVRMGLRIPADVGLISLRVDQKVERWAAGMDLNEDRIAESAATQLAGMVIRNEFGVPPCQQEFLTMGSWVDGPSFRPSVRQVDP